MGGTHSAGPVAGKKALLPPIYAALQENDWSHADRTILMALSNSCCIAT
jgi:hypothetical protein